MSGTEPPKGLKVFISYAHADQRQVEEFMKHAHQLIVDHDLDVWWDKHIDAGTEWTPEIIGRITASDLILLFVSPNFLHSTFIREKELRIAEANHSKRTSAVVSIIVDECEWKHHAFLGSLKAVPTDGKAVSKWKPQKDGWEDAVKLLRQRLAKRSPAPAPPGPNPPPPPVPEQKRGWIWAAIAGLLLAAAGGVYWALMGPRPTATTEIAPSGTETVLDFDSLTNSIRHEDQLLFSKKETKYWYRSVQSGGRRVRSRTMRYEIKYNATSNFVQLYGTQGPAVDAQILVLPSTNFRLKRTSVDERYEKRFKSYARIASVHDVEAPFSIDVVMNYHEAPADSEAVFTTLYAIDTLVNKVIFEPKTFERIANFQYLRHHVDSTAVQHKLNAILTRSVLSPNEAEVVWTVPHPDRNYSYQLSWNWKRP